MITAVFQCFVVLRTKGACSMKLQQPDVGADLKQAPSSLTSLDATEHWYNRAVEHPLSDVIQGLSSLRRLSCKVHARDFLLHLTSVLYESMYR